MTKTQPRHLLSVSQLNREAKQALESRLNTVWVVGEISNLKSYSSGHWYFTLKDEHAQISCAMFRGRNMYVSPKPSNGQQVILRGKVSLYEERGNYQLIAESMEPAGDGRLRQAFEQLKSRLRNEGLFERATKAPLPARAQHIAVITSPTGAAIRDILSILKRRSPDILISIIPAVVQGQNAARELCQAIDTARNFNDSRGQQRRDKEKPISEENINPIDVIILGRGGGSLEDLWPFNEESLARAIFACDIPIVSAVGHETDITISDFVADARAPTPSAAAEMLSSDKRDTLAALKRLDKRLQHHMQNKLNQARMQLDWRSQRLTRPDHKLKLQGATLQGLEARLVATQQQQLLQIKAKLQELSTALNHQHPGNELHRQKENLKQLGKTLKRLTLLRLEQGKQQLSLQSQLLNTVNPLSTLTRGYSITSDSENHIITSITQLQTGETLNTKLTDGCAISSVIQVIPD
jgi:exodeoxyribonuclease VII large subunit